MAIQSSVGDQSGTEREELARRTGELSAIEGGRRTLAQRFNIPRLFGWDESLRVIEMSIVKTPYLLDFGKLYFDKPPADVYDDPVRTLDAEVRANFGVQAATVSRLLYALRERFGIWYIDPKPANINLGMDDPDWDKEPDLDYSQYEDEAAES